MSIETTSTAILAKLEKLKKKCFDAGKVADGEAEKILIDTLHELAKVTGSILEMHSSALKEISSAAKDAAKEVASEAVKSATTNTSKATGKQILNEDSKTKA